ncbi:hypothetical protein, variant, partial [Cladophialophora immunda]
HGDYPQNRIISGLSSRNMAHPVRPFYPPMHLIRNETYYQAHQRYCSPVPAEDPYPGDHDVHFTYCLIPGQDTKWKGVFDRVRGLLTAGSPCSTVLYFPNNCRSPCEPTDEDGSFDLPAKELASRVRPMREIGIMASGRRHIFHCLSYGGAVGLHRHWRTSYPLFA